MLYVLSNESNTNAEIVCSRLVQLHRSFVNQ